MNNTLPISVQKLINHNGDTTAHNNRFIAIENDYEAQIGTEQTRAERVESELEARSLNRYNDACLKINTHADSTNAHNDIRNAIEEIRGQTGYYDYSRYVTLRSYNNPTIRFEKTECSTSQYTISPALTIDETITRLNNTVTEDDLKPLNAPTYRNLSIKHRGRIIYTSTCYPIIYKARDSSIWNLISTGAVVSGGSGYFGTCIVDVFAGDELIFREQDSASHPLKLGYVPWEGANLVPPDQSSGSITDTMLENYATKAYVSAFCGNNVPMTKEEYCSDLTKGVLLTNSNCAWDAACDIALNEPYTSFRFLRVDYTGKSAANINTNIIDVKLFHQLMTSTFSDSGLDIPTATISNQVGMHFNLTGDDLVQQWLIYTSNDAVDNAGAGSYKSTTTLFKYSGSNTALILGIWGFE